MDHFEMVEKLREKAQVSYEEAKSALESCDWDMLDAMVLLEKQGKVSTPESGAYSTRKSHAGESSGHRSEGLGSKLAGILRALLRTGNTNALVVSKNGKEQFALPVTVCVLMLIFMFWITVPLLLIGLFCGYHYSFRGPELGREEVNRAMDKASDMAENIKREVNREIKNDHHDENKNDGE